MATLEELVILLTAESSQLRAELNSASNVTAKAMKDMEKSVKDFTSKSTDNTTTFQKAMAVMAGFVGGNLVLGAFEQVTKFVGFFSNALIDGAQSAIKEEQALTRLANSLALSGKFSKDAIKDLAEFASTMEMLTGVQDDVIEGNLALLSSLTKLDAEGLKAAQRAALDFASATGKDLNTATLMVAKAINGSTDAFGKMGIKISETSDKSAQFTNVITTLNAQFGGSAQGAMKTFAGAIIGVENSFGNLAEAIANSVVKNPVLIAQMQELTKIMTAWTGTVESSSTAMEKLVGLVSLSAVEGFRDLLLVVEAVWDTFQLLIIGAATLSTGLTAMAEGVLFVKNALTGTKDVNPFERSQAAFAALSDLIEKQRGHSIGLIDDLDAVGNAGAKGFIAINAEGKTVEATINNVGVKAQAMGASFKAMYLEQLKSFAEGLASQNLLLSAQFESQRAQLQTALELKEITKSEFFSREKDLLLAKNVAELGELDAFYATQIGKELEFQNAKSQLLMKQDLAERKLKADRAKSEVEDNKKRQQNFSDTLNTIATLSSSSNKTLAAIGKAAAITQATIDGYAAVQKALAAAPPPYNFALAALVGTATAANIAKIAGVGLQGGIDSVPGMGNKDNFPAVLAPGERVVPKDSNKDLKKFLDTQEQGSSSRMTIEIVLRDGLMDFIEAKLLERQATGTSTVLVGGV